MPKQKDLKRIVRARMQKTGESYTAARAQVVRKSPVAARTSRAPVSESQYASLAGMSDAAVRAKTGRTWKQWVRVLDAADAASLPHREIALHLRNAHDVPPWWAQTVTVAYERIRGLRAVGQRRGGGYEVSKSRTMAAPIRKLYLAFRSARTRERWLPDADPDIKKATPEKSVRMAWPDGTAVDVTFLAKGNARSTVTVQHRKLESRKDAEARRAYWGERLETLSRLLAGS